eukprot:TRINITY_DN44090_c0_g1_i2.p1 TRINITY_DN44090_c0_g1~~TRINITY_DN44090_c0_g1_i2.p1  ORF type:complete len:314 (-),score=42.31 TRINITY_DN44090_c0_g1_i2:43-984(-)
MAGALADVRSAQLEAYWRLDGPTSGSGVEVYWPDFDSWLPAKFVKVHDDGSYCIQWKSDNRISDVPTDFVRIPGQDVYTVSNKLKRVDIWEVTDLVEAVCAEMEGQLEGVNRRLQQQNLKPFAEPTLRALLRHGERLLAAEAGEDTNEILPESINPDPHRKPRKPGAFSGHDAVAPERKAGPVDSPFCHSRDTPEVETDDDEPPDLRSMDKGYTSGTYHPVESMHTSQGSAYSAPCPAVEPVHTSPEAAYVVAEPEQATVYCGRRHPLRREAAPYDIDCDRCGRELCCAENVWWCGLCGYCLCNDCHADKAID